MTDRLPATLARRVRRLSRDLAPLEGFTYDCGWLEGLAARLEQAAHDPNRKDR